ncbi:hypothetical protein SPLC1_S540400 [Arthrospira platensis C1]|nr:hypothetical protein SPLC1_S540400 [Arthrospira platensis C1]
MACHSGNQAKGKGDIPDFLSGQPDVLSRSLRQAKSHLKDGVP